MINAQIRTNDFIKIFYQKYAKWLHSVTKTEPATTPEKSPWPWGFSKGHTPLIKFISPQWSSLGLTDVGIIFQKSQDCTERSTRNPRPSGVSLRAQSTGRGDPRSSRWLALRSTEAVSPSAVLCVQRFCYQAAKSCPALTNRTPESRSSLAWKFVKHVKPQFSPGY